MVGRRTVTRVIVRETRREEGVGVGGWREQVCHTAEGTGRRREGRQEMQETDHTEQMRVEEMVRVMWWWYLKGLSTAKYWSQATSRVERREREATTWLIDWQSRHWAVAWDGSNVSKAARGRRRRVEDTLTSSRLMIRVLEVVLKDSFLAKTMRRERLTARERSMVRARMER